MDILYEDNHIIVAVKPHMMPTQADSSGHLDMLTALKQYIKEKYQKPGNVYLGLVHRLDRPAGGVMVFARTSKAASRLSQQVRQGQLGKFYYAAVTGSPPASGCLEDYLAKDSSSNTVRVTDASHGKYAKLYYKIVAQQGGLSLADIQLCTGRPHQIRVQFASRGCPLYGDARYGQGKGDHLALFAYRLTFCHPTLRQEMTFTAAPKDAPLCKLLSIKR